MSLEALAAFAVSNNNATARVAMYDLKVEDARKKVKIKDGNKVPKEDGSQAITLRLGRHTFSLDVISKGATRVNATKEQVAQFTAILQAAVNNGDFDAEIVSAQEKSKPAAKVVEANVPESTEGTLSLSQAGLSTQQVDTPAKADSIEGLDLSSIEA